MPKLNINRIIQESINENVALKLLDEISVELSTLVKELDNDELLDDSNPNDVIKFVKSLNSFTINVIYAIKRCVKNNNLNESNGVFGFLSDVGNKLYNDLNSGGVFKIFDRGYRRNDAFYGNKKDYEKKNEMKYTKLIVLMNNYYPNIEKQYISIDNKYQNVFSRAATKAFGIPRKIIEKMQEIVKTIKDTQRD